MFSFAPAIAGPDDYQDAPPRLDYYSVEFGLNGSHPVYQFKLRHSEKTPHFFLIKETSPLASRLKEGDIMPMKYYRDDTTRTMAQHETRIESIVNETQGRFKGHFRINLSILGDELANVLQPTGTDC